MSADPQMPTRGEFRFADAPDFCERAHPAPANASAHALRVYRQPAPPPRFNPITGKVIPWLNGNSNGHAPRGERVKLTIGQACTVRWWWNVSDYHEATGLDPANADTYSAALLESMRGWYPAIYVCRSAGDRERGLFAVFVGEHPLPFWCALTSIWVKPTAAICPGTPPRWAMMRLL
jgi:hypothetical protein